MARETLQADLGPKLDLVGFEAVCAAQAADNVQSRRTRGPVISLSCEGD